MIDLETQLRTYAAQILDEPPRPPSRGIADEIRVDTEVPPHPTRSRGYLVVSGAAATALIVALIVVVAHRGAEPDGSGSRTREPASSIDAAGPMRESTTPPAATGPNGENRPWRTTPLRLGLDLPGARLAAVTESAWVDHPQVPSPVAGIAFEQHFGVGRGPIWRDDDPFGYIVISPPGAALSDQGPMASDDPMPQTDVNGHPAQVHLTNTGDRARSLSWSDGERRIRVLFTHLDLDEVKTIAERLAVRADGGVDLPPLPHGLVALDDGRQHPPAQGGGTTLDYELPNARIRVDVSQGDQRELERTLDRQRQLSSLNEVRTVRGHDAIVNRAKPRLGTTVTWYEPDHDAVVTLQYIDGLDLQLDDVLSHVTELDAATFDQIRSEASPQRTTTTSADRP